MKTTVLAIIIVLSLVGFSYAECKLTSAESYWGQSFVTVKRIAPGKTKALETWECAVEVYSPGHGICFVNVLDNEGNFRKICFSGEYRVEYPLNVDEVFFAY